MARKGGRRSRRSHRIICHFRLLCVVGWFYGSRAVRPFFDVQWPGNLKSDVFIGQDAAFVLPLKRVRGDEFPELFNDLKDFIGNLFHIQAGANAF